MEEVVRREVARLREKCRNATSHAERERIRDKINSLVLDWEMFKVINQWNKTRVD